MVSFLKEVGLYNIGGVLILVWLIVASIFFIIRTWLLLHYMKRGITTRATITGYKNSNMLVNRDKYNKRIRLRRYTYEYMDNHGVTHSGSFRTVIGLLKYQIGGEVEINYLKSNPRRSRMYTVNHWFMYEFVILFSIILLLIIVAYIVLI